LYPNTPAVFADTGNELDSVRANIDEMIRCGRPIEIVYPKMSFDQVVKKWGYPVVSKKVSDYVNRCRRTKSPQVLRRHLNGENADGSPSPMSKIPNKWQKLLKAPFDVTNKCCGILKCNPTGEYAKRTGRKAFVGTMADESFTRLNSYLNHGGCNAFGQKDACSRPIMFWTGQDVMQYHRENDTTLPTAYAEMINGAWVFQRQLADGTWCYCGDQRTGCKLCLFGIQFEKGENRIQKLARIEPEAYRHAIEDLRYDIVMDELGIGWKPVRDEERIIFKKLIDEAGRRYDGELVTHSCASEAHNEKMRFKMKCENRTCGSNVNGWCQFEAEGDARPSFCKLNSLVGIVSKLDEYIQLLEDELDDCVPTAHANGWRSTRAERGTEMRVEIMAMRDKPNEKNEAFERSDEL